MKVFKKTSMTRLLFTLCFACSMVLSAQQITITVNSRYSVYDSANKVWVPNPRGGGVENALNTLGYSSTNYPSISDLKVITNTANAVYLEPVDFVFLNSLPNLSKLDISDASVTSQVSRTDNIFPRDAFGSNACIKTIIFPKNLIGFARGMFSNSALTGVISIPKTVTNVTEYEMIFGGSRGITGFTVETGNTALKAINGVLYTADGTVLIVYPYGKQDLTFLIPEGVTTLRTNAFGWNDYLEELNFSSTVVNYTRHDQIISGSTKIKKYAVAPGNPKLTTTNGLLVDKSTSTLIAFPPGNTDERLVIDGSIVKIVPQAYFSTAVANLKSIIFTEGFEEVGYIAFKIGTGITSVLEYVELPSTTKTLNGEAFVGNKLLKQVICKATTPPQLSGAQIFRESNGKDARLGVPASSLAAYKASNWNISVNSGTNAFPADQIFAYNNITMVDGTCMQSASVPNYQVNILANPAPAGQSFTSWTSTPATTFANARVPATTFTMPASDITITALFADNKPFSIIDAQTQSGTAAIGSTVYIDAFSTKDGKNFSNWEVVAGNGVVINNPNAASTSFIMVDGTVTIAARYDTAYLITICGGYAQLEAYSGEVITIKAANRDNFTFSNWSSPTQGVIFTNASNQTTTFTMPAGNVIIDGNFVTK